MSQQGLQTIPSGGALAAAEWAMMKEQADMLVKTGFLPPSIKNADQAVAIILTGRELNIPAMAALNNINVIQGKPTISPQLMLALINRSRQLESLEVVTGAEGAIVTMKRRGRAPYVAKFGPEEAKAMGLDSKDNYKKQAGTMYQWRAVAMAARTVFPDVILGLYTPEEMGAPVAVGDTGEMVVEGLPTARAVEHEFVEGEIIEAEADNTPEALKARVLNLCSAMNDAGYQPKWTDSKLKLYLKEWYQAEGLDALSQRDLTKVVSDFEKKLASRRAGDDADRGPSSSRAESAIGRAASAEQS